MPQSEMKYWKNNETREPSAEFAKQLVDADENDKLEALIDSLPLDVITVLWEECYLTQWQEYGRWYIATTEKLQEIAKS